MRRRIRLLPITIFAAGLLLTVRLGGLWGDLAVDVGNPTAAERLPTGTEAGAEAAKARPSGGGSAQRAARADDRAGTAGLDPENLTGAELKLLQELADRRQQLEQRERELEMRVGLLKAAEKRVEQKIAQLKAIQESIQTQIRQRDEQAEAQMQSLVKIYEKMKPKDAARIFDELEMDILLEVIDRMKESKSAPILAAMDSQKAKQVTTELAQKREFQADPARASSRQGAATKGK